jgi:hypothetical protein
MKERTKSILILIGLVAWLVGVATSFVLVWRYKMTPGALPVAPEQWPAATAIVRDPRLATVVMFAHPHCPCTRASLAELNKLSAALGDHAQIWVVIVRPEGTEPGFEEGEIKAQAATVARATVVIDPGGVESERFGAKVSGSTLVYAPDGGLLFRGGITSARGHEGRSAGFGQILALVKDATANTSHIAPSFGCELGERTALPSVPVETAGGKP